MVFYAILITSLLLLTNFIGYLGTMIINKLRSVDPKNTFINLPNFREYKQLIEINVQERTQLGIEYAPFLSYRYRSMKGKTITIDTDFHRTSFVNHKIKKNGKNIFFFGGSTMWGWGEIDNHTIPSFWSHKNPQWNVINCGQMGYNSRQNVEELINNVTEGRKIDVAVFYVGINDLHFYCAADDPILQHGFYKQYKKAIESSGPNLFYGLFFKNIVNFYNAIHPMIEEDRYGCDCSNPLVKSTAEMTVNTWLMAKEIVENQGGKFLLVLQPNAFFGSPRVDYLDEKTKLDFSKYEKKYQCFYTAILDYAKQKKYNWIHFPLHTFDGTEYIYFDFCHVSATGNRKMAMVIDSLLMQ